MKKVNILKREVYLYDGKGRLNAHDTDIIGVFDDDVLVYDKMVKSVRKVK